MIIIKKVHTQLVNNTLQSDTTAFYGFLTNYVAKNLPKLSKVNPKYQ